MLGPSMSIWGGPPQCLPALRPRGRLHSENSAYNVDARLSYARALVTANSEPLTANNAISSRKTTNS